MPELKWRKESANDVASLVLGAGLIAAPWIFGFKNVEMASRSDWIAGAIICVEAMMALIYFVEWEEWINLLLGLWVAASPWALSFNFVISQSAVRAHVALGLAVAALAAAELYVVHRGSILIRSGDRN